MKKGIKQKIEKIFGRPFKRIVLYKNPNEFTKIYIEKVNPTHEGILWGKRNKKFNKGTHFIKFGRVYFELIPISIGATVLVSVDIVTNYIHVLILQAGIFGIILSSILSIIIFVLPFEMEERCSKLYSVLE